MRDVRCEISLDEVGRRLEQSTVRLENLLAAQVDSPSGYAIQREREIQLADGAGGIAGGLSGYYRAQAHQRDVVRGNRTKHGAIGGCARMLWLRALKKLRVSLETVDAR